MLPIREMLEPSGLTEQQWRVLRVLAEHGSQDASTLAARACLLFPSLTRIAKGMQAKGLITQTRDTQDRRRQIIALTDQGQAIIDDNTARAAEIVLEFKAILGEANYEQLLDLLALLQRDEPNGD